MQEYQQNETVLDRDLLGESEDVRANFIKKTYTHLAMAIGLFIIIEALFLNTPMIVNFMLSMTSGFSWLLLLGGFMLATNYAEKWAMRSTEPSGQYGALVLFVIAEALLFVPLIYMAMQIAGDLALVRQAGMLTLALFTGISAVAILSGKDFSGIKNVLMIGGILAMGTIVAGIAFGFTLGLFFSLAMVLLAAGSILYQTSNLVHKYNTNQHVAASLGLFGSFMLLFWYILDIVMRFSGD